MGHVRARGLCFRAERAIAVSVPPTNRSNYPFTLRQLQYALAVAEELSFRRAAESCGVSQPSLSAQVATLEEGLGVELFERDTRRVMLTAAGEVLLAQARRIVADVELLEAGARLAQDPFRGTWRIGVIPTIAPYLLPQLTVGIGEVYPSLSLMWKEDRTESLKGSLLRGELDLALVALEADLGDMETAAIGWEPFVVAASHGHPLLAAPRPLALDTLSGHPILLLEEGHCLRDQALRLCSRVRLRRQAFDATSLATVTQMVATGLGITLLPATAVSIECQRARLATAPLAETEGAGRTVGLAWRRLSPFAPAFREFARTLAKLPGMGLDAKRGYAGDAAMT